MARELHDEVGPTLTGRAEALTNVVRHAQASQVDLELHNENRETVLTIRDDGRGMASGSLPSSNGIRGMRERAMLIGAQLTIESRPGQGTEVRLSLHDAPEDSNPDR